MAGPQLLIPAMFRCLTLQVADVPPKERRWTSLPAQPLHSAHCIQLLRSR